jgi:hypothetical protein
MVLIRLSKTRRTVVEPFLHRRWRERIKSGSEDIRRGKANA